MQRQRQPGFRVGAWALVVAAMVVGCSSTAPPETDGGSPARGACNTDQDCVFQASDGCCGACLATTDTPQPSTRVCTVYCPARPGGCSCVDHVCTSGVLTQGQSCDPLHDACNNGLKCCSVCPGVLPVDASPTCSPPVCTGAAVGTGTWMCPLFP